MKNDSRMFLGSEFISDAPIKYTLGTQCLSAFGVANTAENSTGALLLFGYQHNSEIPIDPAYWLTLLQQSASEIVAALDKLDGAFTIVILNKADSTINIVTDRLGGQRLHYSHMQKGVWLSTSLTGLAEMVRSTDKKAYFSAPALMELLHYRWLSGSKTLFSTINKLPHAAWCQLSPDYVVSVQARYGLLPKASAVDVEPSLQQHADNVRQLLMANVSASVQSGDRVAVLLSGGVDSSVLLGVCCELNLNVVAITPLHEGHHNPELETAKTFAAELGVEHRIIEIKEADVAALYADVIALLGAPPRCHSAVSLLHIMRQLQGHFDKVLYGEGADTLFGSKAVKHYSVRLKKHQRLNKLLRYVPLRQRVLQLLPVPEKLLQLLQFNAEDAAIAVNQLALNPQLQQHLHHRLTFERSQIQAGLNTDVMDPQSYASALLLLKQVIFSSSVINHFYELESLAAQSQIQLISPFVCQSVMAYAANLSDNTYFGADVVKPVLRKIGERYFTPSLMYLPKYGFPVPYSNWLAGPLSGWSKEAAAFFACPLKYLADEEFSWTLVGLYLLAKQHDMLPFPLLKAGAVADV